MTDNRTKAAQFAGWAENEARNAGTAINSATPAALASAYASLAVFYLLLAQEDDAKP